MSMDMLTGTKKKTENEHLKSLLIDGITRGLEKSSGEQLNLPVYRIEIPIARHNILPWLSKQNDALKAYWSSRNGDFEMGGVGTADLISGIGQVDYKSVVGRMRNNVSAQIPRMRYYGGFCFDQNNLDEEWKRFGAYRFWLPRFEIVNGAEESYFACNVPSLELKSEGILLVLENAINELDFSPGKNSELHLLPKSRQDFPTYPEWAQTASQLIRSFQKGTLEKAVLARKTLFHFAKPLPPFEVMAQVKNMSPDCFHFCFQIGRDTAFLGASPERLYRRQGSSVLSEAIAGTRPRGRTFSEDEKYQKELTDSTKEGKEHQFVVDSLRDNLLALCRDFKSAPAASILKLKDGQHLISRFEGTLKSGISDDELLAAFHPTPAVAGCPTGEALKTIRELEPFKRGWYAAPVGWIGPDGSEFAVAIRSGMIQNDQLALYSGAGLVKGSNPEAEWDEIENKMSSFMAVFK